MKLRATDSIPKVVFEAIEYLLIRHEHRQGDYSTTGLAKSARQYQLILRHYDEIVIELDSVIWMVLGTIGHYLIAQHDSKNALKEEYLETEIMGKILSGILDIITTDHDIPDIKFTSSYNVKNKSSLKEWEAQLNGYSYLLHKHGIEARDLYIVAFIRDWMRSKVGREANYPEHPVVTIPIAKWGHEATEMYIFDRVAYHEQFAVTQDDELPECTREERWQRDDVFAVMKEGRKTAVKLFDDHGSAQEHAKNLGDKHSVQIRHGEWGKCEQYCFAAAFCNQFKKYKAQFAPEPEEENG